VHTISSIFIPRSGKLGSTWLPEKERGVEREREREKEREERAGRSVRHKCSNAHYSMRNPLLTPNRSVCSAFVCSCYHKNHSNYRGACHSALSPQKPKDPGATESPNRVDQEAAIETLDVLGLSLPISLVTTKAPKLDDIFVDVFGIDV
jgi:hypothetical protein